MEYTIGNPGPAASGICAWRGRFIDGNFSADGLLFQRGFRLGLSTNNVAEAHGLASAIKMTLRYYFWVTERLAQLAAHSWIE